MNAALAWWGRMREPTLQRRSVAFVLAGFVVTWLVLLAYAYVQNERVIAREQPFRRFAEAVHRTLEATPDAGQAAAIVRATVQWVNERRGHGTRLPALDGRGTAGRVRRARARLAARRRCPGRPGAPATVSC